MSYVNSSNIRIFPSSNRGVNSGHFGNNFATEYNLSSIVNKLLSPYIGGESGFLISPSLDGTLSEDPAEFNIGGYFIEVSSWSTVIAAALANPNNSADTGVGQSSFVTFTCRETSSGNRIYIESDSLMQLSDDSLKGTSYSGSGPYYIEATISVADVSANATDLSENSVVLEDKSYRVMQGEDITQVEGGADSTSNLNTDKTFTLRLIDCESADDVATISTVSNWKLHDESRLSFVNFRVDDGDLDSSPFTGE